MSHNLGLLDLGRDVTQDCQIVLREEHPSVFEEGETQQIPSFFKVRIEFSLISEGATLFVPASVPLTASVWGLPSRFDAGTTTGRLRLVNNDGDEISASRKHYAGASARGLAIVPIAPEEQFMYGRRSRFVTYEVVDCDPNVIETVVVEVYVAFESDVAKNRPSIGTPIAT